MGGHNKVIVGWIQSKLEKSGPEDPLVFHCIVHQEALCGKVLSWKEIIETIISTVNFVRKNGLMHHQFQKFLEDMDADHDYVYYCEVRAEIHRWYVCRCKSIQDKIEALLNTWIKQTRSLS